MIPRFKPDLGISEFLSSLNIFTTYCIEDFEKDFAQKFNVKNALLFSYGRTALYFLLKAMDISNAEIICPAYTCIVVPNAIVLSGNKPVFVDSKLEDFNMNLELAETMITPNTKAIIATSIFGYPANTEILLNIKKKYPDIIIIQDCGHSFGTCYKNKPVHKIGTAAIFSLGISKLITSVQGGILTTDNDDLAAKLRNLRDKELINSTKFQILKKFIFYLLSYPTFNEFFYTYFNICERKGLLDGMVKYYEKEIDDLPDDFYNYPADFCLRIGQQQLKKYNKIIDIRKKVFKYYSSNLKLNVKIKKPPLVEGATYSHYTLLVENRSELMEQCLKKNIQLGGLIEYCAPKTRLYKNYKTTPTPVAERFVLESVNLPPYSLTAAERTTTVINSLIG